MIKYKVKDAAADLKVPNKKITEILEKYCGVSKKTMTTLTEGELDVIFDVITRENSVENFDKYFAARNEKLDSAPEPVKEEAPKSREAEKAEAKPAAKKQDSKQPAAQQQEKKGEAPSHQRKRKVIDTRATNVDVERYNSKYDDLASGTSKSRSTDRDHTTKKQKFSNRSSAASVRASARPRLSALRGSLLSASRSPSPSRSPTRSR